MNQQAIDGEQLRIDKENARQDRNSQLDRESNEYIAETKARATLADSNANPEALDAFFEKEQLEQNERDNKVKNDIKQQEVDLKKEKQKTDLSGTLTNLDLQFLKLREDAKDRAARREQSKDNVAIARINP